MSTHKLDKILKEIEKEKGKKKDPLKQHPHIIESRRHWDWDVGMYEEQKQKDE